jgi:hypothetical protein
MMTRALFTTVLASGLVISASAQPPRVAIVSDAGSKDLAVLETTELSSNPALTLVERDDLAKIGDEAKVQQMAGSDATALGKLLNADGILFLEQRADGPHVRLTAVNLGYALFDNQVPDEITPQQEAKALAHLIENDAAKLKLTSTQAIPISVLNLRADYATTDALKTERDLTLLVESQLAAVPEYVVLERRHAWDLGFERSLDLKSSPLLEGAFVIDGTLSQPALGEIDVHLRLRPPHGEAVESTIQGSSQDLSGLAKKLVVEVQRATGSSSTAEWRPEDEAHEYLLEGIWGWQHKADEAALEALDSAELLGEKMPQLFAVRSEVLSSMAGSELKIENERIILPATSTTMAAEQRATLIIRAIEDAVRFRDLKSGPPASPDAEVLLATQWIDPNSIVIPLATNILVLLDRDAPAQADAVRTALRELTKFDPEHGTLGPFHSAGHATQRDLFLEEWPATLDEQLAAYHLACATPNDWVPTVMLQDSAGFCPRFLKTPDDQRKQFDALVQSLQSIPAAHMRCLLIRASSKDPAQADAAYQAYLTELWTQRDAFIQTRNIPPDWACGRELPDDVKIRNAKAALPLLHYVLANRERFEGNFDVPLSILWQPAGWSRDDAAAIWKEYLAYKARVQGNTPDAFFEQFEIRFNIRFPGLATAAPLPPTPSSGALVVTKFWYPWRYTSALAGYYYGGIVAGNGHYVWDNIQQGQKRTLVRIDLDDFSSTIFPDPAPSGSNPFSYCAMPDALYGVGETNGHNGSGQPLAHEIARLDSGTGTWTTHAIPDCSDAKVYGAGTELYLFLNSRAAGNEDAIDRYDWDQDQVAILASTRRRPAQNQLENRTRLLYAQVYAGPGGKPCVTTMDGTFYIQDSPGPWPEAFDSAYAAYSTPAGNATLVVGGANEVVLLDPQAPAATPLLTPVQPYFRKPPAPGTKPVKGLPSWAAQASWDAPAGVRFYYTNVAYHNGSLYIVQEPKAKGGDYTLLCYQKRTGRSPRKIALRFQLDDRTRADLASKPDGAPALWLPTEIEHPDTIRYPGPGVHLFCTDSGICFVPMDLGFWYLPYADLEAYLQAQPSQAPVSVEVQTATPAKPSPSPSSEDKIDPGNPTSFP